MARCGCGTSSGCGCTIRSIDASITVTPTVSGFDIGAALAPTTFTLAGDTGTSQTIVTGNTLTIAGGTAIATVASATDTITVNLDLAELPTGAAGALGGLATKDIYLGRDGQFHALPATAATPWAAATLLNGWGNVIGHTAGYRLNIDVVELRGLITKALNPTLGQSILTLPAGFRPPLLRSFALATNTGESARVDVDSSGNVLWHDEGGAGGGAASAAQLSLDGIRFSVTA